MCYFGIPIILNKCYLRNNGGKDTPTLSPESKEQTSHTKNILLILSKKTSFIISDNKAAEVNLVILLTYYLGAKFCFPLPVNSFQVYCLFV